MNSNAPWWAVSPNTGRLGNLLFQIAAVYAHCLRNNRVCYMPWNANALTRALGDFIGRPLTMTNHLSLIVYWYPLVKYIPFPDDLPNGAIAGYFTNSRYWKHDHEATIRNMYSNLVHPDKLPGTAAVHIRLGDYLKPYNKGQFWVATDDYLAEAVSRLSPQINELMVFSDSPKEAYARLMRVVPSGRFKAIHVDTSPETASIEVLREMTRYGELIMSASTFSWWGAFLGRPRQVFVPKIWFNHTITDWEDVFEPEWTIL